MTIPTPARPPAVAGRGGFTMLELVVALFITGLVLLAAWSMFAAAGDQQLSVWREANRRSDLGAAERAVSGAIARAGTGMPSSANLGGVHVAVAGAGADTLYTLEGKGPRLRVASRACPAAAAGICVLVLGDQRHVLHVGATVVIGTAGAGLRVMRIAEAPDAFSAACGADCPQRVLCVLAYEDAGQAPAIAGSLRTPPAPAAPIPSADPCPQPVLADGTACTENETAVTVTPITPATCTAAGPASAYTRVLLAPVGGWGLPSPQVAPPLRGGGTPAPLLEEVLVTRFWVRGEDSTLVKQAGPSATGWESTQPLAPHVVSLTAELVHAGAGWSRGLEMPPGFLDHGPYNPNYVREAPADSAPPAWRFRYGYHTVAAVRVTLGLLRPAGDAGWTLEPRAFVTATPAIRDGSRGEGDL